MKILKSIKLLWIIPLALGAIFSISVAKAAPILQEIAAASVLETIKKRGLLKVGVSTFVPWSIRNLKGDLIGYEIDVATRLADDSGWKIEFVPTQFAGIIPALLAGKFDIIITGMAQTQKRNLTVNFTNPYQYFTQAIAVNKKLGKGVTKWQDLNRKGVNLASRRGGFTKDIILASFPLATIRWFDDDAQVFQEVINGNAHAAFGPEPKPSFYILQYPDVLHKAFEDTPVPGIPGALAVRKGDHDVLNY